MHGIRLLMNHGIRLLMHSINLIGFLIYVESDIRRCMLAHKRINGEGPEYLKDLLVLNSEVHSRSTRGAGLLFRTPKYYRQTEGGKRFSTCTSKLWNSLPLNIRSIALAKTFKRSIINIFLEYQKEHKHFTTFTTMFSNY